MDLLHSQDSLTSPTADPGEHFEHSSDRYFPHAGQIISAY